MTLQLSGKQSAYLISSSQPFIKGRLADLYLAKDTNSNRDVVLKIFRSSLGEPDSIEGFNREIDALLHLRHSHILELIDSGKGSGAPAGESFFLVLPHMKGGNLRALLHAKAFCPPETVLPILCQIAEAIDHAHSSGLIHGDIKPENILLDEDRQTAYLADFGVARHFDIQDRVAVTAVRPVRGIGGTSAYLSPEQLAENEQSPKSDIYSFGLVAFELLTGKLPFDVDAPLYRQLHARVSGDLIHPHDLNPSLNKRIVSALERALDPIPKNRPGNARAFVSLLEIAKRWDIFIAHAGSDQEIAEQLYGAIGTRTSVFLDTKCLSIGDSWDLELSNAQKDSLVTVVLVSQKVEDAFYQREEIARAIREERENPEIHRVVPIFTDAESVKNPPYGLTLKHGIKIESANDIHTAADSLVQLVERMAST